VPTDLCAAVGPLSGFFCRYDLLGAPTNVTKRCQDHPGQYNRMPLYFAAIEQLIGLRDEHDQPKGEGRWS
jgi:hypothetical protein